MPRPDVTTAPTSNRWTALAVLTFARTAMGFQFQSVGAVSPLLVERLHISNADLGWLIGLFSLPGIVVALPGGLLGDRFGDRRVVLMGLSLMTVGSAVMGVAEGYSAVVVGRVISAAGAIVLNVLPDEDAGGLVHGRGDRLGHGHHDERVAGRHRHRLVHTAVDRRGVGIGRSLPCRRRRGRGRRARHRLSVQLASADVPVAHGPGARGPVAPRDLARRRRGLAVDDLQRRLRGDAGLRALASRAGRALDAGGRAPSRSDQLAVHRVRAGRGRRGTVAGAAGGGRVGWAPGIRGRPGRASLCATVAHTPRGRPSRGTADRYDSLGSNGRVEAREPWRRHGALLHRVLHRDDALAAGGGAAPGRPRRVRRGLLRGGGHQCHAALLSDLSHDPGRRRGPGPARLIRGCRLVRSGPDLLVEILELVRGEAGRLADGDDLLLVSLDLGDGRGNFRRDLGRDGHHAVLVEVHEVARLDPYAAHLDGDAEIDHMHVGVRDGDVGRRELEFERAHLVQIAHGTVGDHAHATEGAMDVGLYLAPLGALAARLVEVVHDDYARRG